MQLYCKICSCPVDNFKHFFSAHKLTYQQYYDTYLKTKNNGFCKMCHKETYWDPNKHEYCIYCSPRCRNLDPEWMKLRNKIMLKRYGILTIPPDKEKADNGKKKRAEIELIKLSKLFTDGFIKNYDYNTKIITAYCNKCNTEFSENIAVFRHRLHTSKITGCPYCLKQLRHNGESREEQVVLNYIKTIYNGDILTHAKGILKNTRLELDFYFPDLNKAIEYDGTYWHADKRFYKANDLVEGKRTKARVIWKRDKKKDDLCNDLNIKLFRIKEYDWSNNLEEIKNQIKNFLLKE